MANFSDQSQARARSSEPDPGQNNSRDPAFFSPFLHTSPSGLLATYSGSSLSSNDFGVYISSSFQSYFEISIENSAAEEEANSSSICVGFLSLSTPQSSNTLTQAIGKLSPSFGLQSNGDQIFALPSSSKLAISKFPSSNVSFGIGDVIGCGLVEDVENDVDLSYYFTKNGQILGTSQNHLYSLESDDTPMTSFRPAVSLHSIKDSVCFNFKGPFLYDRIALTRQKDKEEAKQLSLDPSIVQLLVKDFLLTHGYGKTIAALWSSNDRAQEETKNCENDWTGKSSYSQLLSLSSLNDSSRMNSVSTSNMLFNSSSTQIVTKEDQVISSSSSSSSSSSLSASSSSASASASASASSSVSASASTVSASASSSSSSSPSADIKQEKDLQSILNQEKSYLPLPSPKDVLQSYCENLSQMRSFDKKRDKHAEYSCPWIPDVSHNAELENASLASFSRLASAFFSEKGTNLRIASRPPSFSSSSPTPSSIENQRVADAFFTSKFGSKAALEEFETSVRTRHLATLEKESCSIGLAMIKKQKMRDLQANAGQSSATKHTTDVLTSEQESTMTPSTASKSTISFNMGSSTSSSSASASAFASDSSSSSSSSSCTPSSTSSSSFSHTPLIASPLSVTFLHEAYQCSSFTLKSNYALCDALLTHIEVSEIKNRTLELRSLIRSQIVSSSSSNLELVYTTLHEQCPQILLIPSYRVKIDVACSCLHSVNLLCLNTDLHLATATTVLENEIRPLTQRYRRDRNTFFSILLCQSDHNDLLESHIDLTLQAVHDTFVSLSTLTKTVCKLFSTMSIDLVQKGRGEVVDMVSDIITESILRFELFEIASKRYDEKKSKFINIQAQQVDRKHRGQENEHTQVPSDTLSIISTFQPFTLASLSYSFRNAYLRACSASTVSTVSTVSNEEAAAASIALRILQLKQTNRGKRNVLNNSLADLISTSRITNQRFNQVLSAAEVKAAHFRTTSDEV
jgi:hypothetical protein